MTIDKYRFETGVYRPPSEGGSASLLVRFTRNCPWNHCTFCSMYKTEKFQLRPLSEILADIDAMAALTEDIKALSAKSASNGGITREGVMALLEKNPEYFFEKSTILIIGRQITTNLNSFIDLMGIDGSGNTLVIELKRDKTPRETIAQLLEYASFVERLDYSQLNEIYQEPVRELSRVM